AIEKTLLGVEQGRPEPSQAAEERKAAAAGRVDQAILKALDGGDVPVEETPAVADVPFSADEPAAPAPFALPNVASSSGASQKPAGTSSLPPTGSAPPSLHQVIVAADTRSPVAEEYRKLKTALLMAAGETTSRIFLVTSSVGGEGKSVTAANLAVSLSQEYDLSVLLVDADMRNPTIGELFGIDAPSGLSDYLSGANVLDEVIVRSGIRNLSILPAGGRVGNPTELLSSQMSGGGCCMSFVSGIPTATSSSTLPPSCRSPTRGYSPRWLTASSSW
ncbi:MAG TPA: P-loop NTPase, partial [Verrucomicrobiae bacterium]|nr:P-loop NTPase [Verrucomicrobiae bacterium]